MIVTPSFFQISEQRPRVRDSDSDSQLVGWSAEATGRIYLGEGTHYFYNCSGDLDIACASGRFRLGEGMFGSIPGECRLVTSGAGFVVTRHGYRGFFHLGGPVEERGRLKYIDGCTDSLLVPPILAGDPCLNLLHIPANTRQTAHTHPSVRMGAIISGEGVCVTPDRIFDLHGGVCFCLPAGCEHSFHTECSDLRVIAYHPDSDFGPTDFNHPMVNRTYVDGISASEMGDLLTR